jgi:integrase
MASARCSGATALEQKSVRLSRSVPTSAYAIYAPRAQQICTVADRSSIHKIQVLLGHKSVQTTEVYLMGLVSEIVRPNEVPIIALVKK